MYCVAETFIRHCSGHHTVLLLPVMLNKMENGRGGRVENEGPFLLSQTDASASRGRSTLHVDEIIKRDLQEESVVALSHHLVEQLHACSFHVVEFQQRDESSTDHIRAKIRVCLETIHANN